MATTIPIDGIQLDDLNANDLRYFAPPSKLRSAEEMNDASSFAREMSCERKVSLYTTVCHECRDKKLSVFCRVGNFCTFSCTNLANFTAFQGLSELWVCG